MRTALIVTITEGPELQPQAAFLSSALRTLGFETKLLPTDYCTTRDSFQAAVRGARPDAVAFVDGLEWREILVTLSGFAVAAIEGPVVVASAVDAGRTPPGFDGRVRFVLDGDLAALAGGLGAGGGPPDAAALRLDYDVFGGAGLLERAMGCSLFGDVGTLALVACRRNAGAGSPTAALARLEAPVGLVTTGLALTDDAVWAPLRRVGKAVRAIEWWDRQGVPGALLDRAQAEAGCAQTVRLPVSHVHSERLAGWKASGVRRLVFECDALDEALDVRLPGSAATTLETAAAIGVAKAAGFEAGVLLVVGVPGETAELAKARCEKIRDAGPDRVRVVPFEPAGGTAAYDWCVRRGLWPPRENRWNRELYQPLEQPAKSDWPRTLEHALMLVADVEARAGARA